MSAFNRKMQEAYKGQLSDSRGWGAVEKLVRERIREEKAKAWAEATSEAAEACGLDHIHANTLNPYLKETASE